jgi:hypothetical protein
MSFVHEKSSPRFVVRTADHFMAPAEGKPVALNPDISDMLSGSQIFPAILG